MNPVDPTQPVPVAIIGMGCLFPKAEDLSRFWANIRHRRDAITEVPSSHWRSEDYFDADPKSPDHTYARRGGFLDPIDFAPLEFGIAPNNLEATDTTQLLGLVAAREALEDAGYGEGSKKPLDRDRVSVVLGVTGTLELVIPLGARLGHPIWRRALKASGVPHDTAEEVVKRIADSYVGWQENSFPGLLGNVAAGRIANRLDLGGTNCVIDAACASSIGALNLAMLELASGRCDMALSGGLDTFNDIFMYMCFSKTPALSPRGDARPFDAGCDGTILGEGLGVIALKRLDDARRDGDKIYAVIRSVGSSSDGKGNAVYAPKAEGQTRALRHAYTLAGISPATIGLLEAHGTGTKVGDATELSALNEVYREAGAEGTWCALGSVKSQIGHTKAAAGAAGLIKAALALYHKVLPPTIKVDQPIEGARAGQSPFYVNTEARPWLPKAGQPRRAAVSAFGFGGSNFHCVLEEAAPVKTAIDWDGETQIVAFSAASREEIARSLEAFPAGLGWSEFRVEAAKTRVKFRYDAAERLVMAALRNDDLSALFAKGKAALGHVGVNGKPGPGGVFVGSGPAPGGLAMLFPGQGSQYVGMLRELSCVFPQMQAALGEADALDGDGAVRLSDRIYPFPAFDDATRARNAEALQATEAAQPAIGALSLGLFRVLEHFGLKPDAVGGHSYGELTALCAAGRIDARSFGYLSRERGLRMAEQAKGGTGGMIAVLATEEVVGEVLEAEGLGLVVANKNSPKQFVLSGPRAEVERAALAFERRKVGTRLLAVSAAFHSPAVAGASGPFLEALRSVEIRPSETPVYANINAELYPADAEESRQRLAGQITRPVEFVREIEAMAKAGMKVFLEVGPDAKLSGLVRSILDAGGGRTIAVDGSRGERGNMADLALALAELAAFGYPIKLPRWDEPDHESSRPVRKPGLTVKVSGANFGPKPASTPEPKRPAPNPAPVAHSPMTPPAHSKPQPSASHHSNGDHPPAAANGQAKDASRNGRNHDHSTPAPVATNGTLASSRRAATSVIPLGSTDPGLISQALRSAQDNLVALQRLSEQTAELHKQFLDGQEKVQRTFQSLLDRQHELTFGQGRVSAPSAPPSRVVQPAGRVIAEPAKPVRRERSTTLASRQVAESAAVPVVAETPAITNAPATSFTHVEKVLLEVVAEKTGYPAEMLEPTMQLDADLGIDSIKRVEILSALQERLPDAPIIKPEHLGTLRTLNDIITFLAEGKGREAVETQSSSSEVLTVLLEVVAEKTGYPAEMLEPTMQLDADLGIDSIKRVEILSALQERLPDSPIIKPEHLGTIRTLSDIVAFLTSGGGAQAPIAVLADSTAVQAVLLDVVAEKTGYPAEMLEPTMQLDADLGIDSIKRVEILSALQERLPDAPIIKPEHLGTLRTIQDIVTFLVNGSEHKQIVETPSIAKPAAKAEALAGARVQRLALKCVALADGEKPGERRIRAGGAVWVTDDRSGLSAAMVARLVKKGYNAELVAWGDAATAKAPDRLDALLLIAPARGDGERIVMDAFRWLRLTGPGLRRAGGESGGLAVSVSRLDGAFGLGAISVETEPDLGGLAGLIKTAALEWPEVHARAIDLDPAMTDVDTSAAALMHEIVRDGPIEVGLSTKGRVGLKLRPELAAPRSSKSPIGPGDVVIVTGGARGVTAEVAVGLAEAFQPTLVLLGRTEIPQGEPGWLASLTGEVEIKRALATRANGHANPQRLGQEFKKLAANREILENLERIEAAGAKVVYRSLDVKERATVGDEIKLIREEFGPIRGLIHGAGVLADRRIEDQTDAQFAEVYATKVDGLRSLLGAVGAEELRLLVLFSSSTARFGRAGQAAYAAANEALNKYAQRESRTRRDCRVISVNWGPWDGGMVTPSLKPLFASEGVGLIPLAEGARFLVEEIQSGGLEAPVEVVVLGGDSDLSKIDKESEPAAKPVHAHSSTLKVMFERPLDPDAMPILRSHVIDGRAVVPLALTLEFLAQGALQRNPGLSFHGVEGLKLLKGIVHHEERPETIVVMAGKALREGSSYRAAVELRGVREGGKTIAHARADVILGVREPEPGRRSFETAGLPAYSRSMKAVYHDVLFHGPDLHGLDRIEACGPEGILASAHTAPAPTAWLERPLRQAWLSDPLAIDCAFQLMVLWSYEQTGAPSLPTAVGRYTQYRRAFPTGKVRIAVSITRFDALSAAADIEFLDNEGNLVARVEGYECVSNPSLNQAFRRNRLPKVARSPR